MNYTNMKLQNKGHAKIMLQYKKLKNEERMNKRICLQMHYHMSSFSFILTTYCTKKDKTAQN